jgi:hypothetical protein
VKNVLPVKKPLINTYTSYGALFSILPNGLDNWVYNNFIQLNYASGWKMYTFENHKYLISECPGLIYSVFPEFITRKSYFKSIRNMIRAIIDEGEYLYLYIDRYYLSVDKIRYMNYHFPHELFVYGYDFERGLAYIADNLLNGKFVFTTCPLEDIENGFNNIESEYEFMKMIRTIKVRSNVDYPLDMAQIRHGIFSFITSSPSYHVNKEHDMLFGLDIFDSLHRQFSENKSFIDVRALHLIHEQIMIMNKRVSYLIESDKLTSSSKLVLEELKGLMHGSLILRNSAIKYSVYNTDSLYNSIQEKILLLKDRISSVYCSLLKQF